jgi:hypothetical protein
MSGAVAGLIASVQTFTAPSGNLVLNPSFDIDVSPWQYSITRDIVTYRSAPASGKVVYDASSELAITQYTRNGSLTIGQNYSASVWVRNNLNSQSFTLALGCGTTFKYTTVTLPVSTSWVNIKVENTVCTTNTNLNLQIYGDFYDYNIDDVSLVTGATAIP